MPVRLDSRSADFVQQFLRFLATKREVSADIERAVDKVYADGIKPMEFGGSNGTADIAKAVLAAL